MKQLSPTSFLVKFLSLWILTFLLTTISGFGQKKISPEWITIDDGLSQGFISALYQDTNGFLWIGTKTGLDRYDGRSFKNFTNTSFDITESQNHQIRSISGSREFLLLATEGNLYLHFPKYKKFYPFKFGKGFGQIYKQDDQTFWLVAADGNLFKLHVKKQIPHTSSVDFDFDTYFSIEKNAHTDVNSYYKISRFENSLVYFQKQGSYKELMLFDLETEQPKSLPLFKYSKVASGKKIGYVVFDDSILVYTDEDLFVFHQGIWKQYTFQTKIINALNLKKQQKVVISTLNEYLFFDYTSIRNGRMNRSNASLIYPTKKTQFYNALEDYSENIWIGTAGYGLIKVSKKQMKIQHFFEGKSIYAKPFVSKKETVFINNPTTGEKLLIPGDPKESEYIKQFSEAHREVDFVQNSSDGTLWGLSISGYYIDIYKLTPVGFRFFSRVDTKFGYHIRLFDIEPKTNQLIIAIGDRLIYINLYTGQKKGYRHRRFLNLLSLFIEKEDRLWLGAEQGLLKVEKNGDSIKHHLLHSKNSNLISNRVASIYQDKDDTTKLWIGSKGAGLLTYNIEKDFFERPDIEGKFPDNTIYGILEDDSQNLWLSSNKGLIRYNKTSNEIKHFTKNDGLQGNEFNTYAYKKGNNSLFYFGGTNGLSIFNPDDLTENDYLAKSFITGIELNNKPLKSDISYEYLKNLELDYMENNLSFTFASTELTAVQKNQFSYYLEGAEEDWTHTSLNNKANYLNLRPGSYTLKLKSSNSDGIWNSSYHSLNIHIKAPWYESNIAYFLYFALILSFIVGIVKFRENRINRIREQEKIALENELLESRINYKEKDLMDMANAISENERWREYLLNFLRDIKKARGRAKTKLYNDLINQIKTKTSIENSRKGYQKHIDTLNNEFNSNLLEQYPKLSKNDLRLCALIKLDFTTKEIALIQNIEVRSVYINRSRLRKKMGLSNETDLVALLKSIS